MSHERNAEIRDAQDDRKQDWANDRIQVDQKSEPRPDKTFFKRKIISQGARERLFRADQDFAVLWQHCFCGILL